MNKRNLKISIVIFITALLLLTGHICLHGLEKDDSNYLLCNLLAAGFTYIEQYELLLLLLFIAIIPQIKLFQLIFLARFQIQLRAPPYYLNF